MFKLSFVILHYIALDETKEAVDSIFQKSDLSVSEYAIVIVDNASPNKSGRTLEEEYRSYTNVFVIINEKNEGFSAGHNTGFIFAKNKLGSRYIVLMNNDTTILSDNFYHKIESDYKKYGYAVLGPRVYINDNKNGMANPANIEDYKSTRLKIKRWDCRILLLLNVLGIDIYYAKLRRWIPDKVRDLLKKKKSGINDIEYYLQPHEDVLLHGCFWIFSPIFISQFDGLDEVTFMYHEEIILYKKVKSSNMKMLYDPKIEIFHGNHVSTNSVCDFPRKSRKIRYKRELNSLKALFKYLQIK